MIAFNLSPERQQALQEWAADTELTPEQLAEEVLSRYLDERIEQIEPPSDNEIAAVLETLRRSRQPGAVSYTEEVVDAEIDAMIENYPSSKGN